jgi:hypothetical protein
MKRVPLLEVRGSTSETETTIQSLSMSKTHRRAHHLVITGLGIILLATTPTTPRIQCLAVLQFTGHCNACWNFIGQGE